MKRLLACILLIANLTSGLAFAWDTHPEAVVGHDLEAIALVAGDDHDHSDGDLHHEDHCCHGASHLMGLFGIVEPAIIENTYEYRASLTVGLPSLYIPPLLRPPIA